MGRLRQSTCGVDCGSPGYAKDVQRVGDGDCRGHRHGSGSRASRAARGSATRLRLHAEPAWWLRVERYFFFAMSIRFVSASPLPDLLASEGEPVHGGSAGPVHGGSARWNPVCGIWTRHDGDGRHPPGGADSETLALEGVSFGWDSFTLRYSARDLLRRPEQRQRDQHEFRHYDGIGGTAESPRLHEAERRDLRGVCGKRREDGNCISRSVANRCDGRGVND